MPRVTPKDVLSMAVKRTPARMQYDMNKDKKITPADALAYSKTARGQAAQLSADRKAAAIAKRPPRPTQKAMSPAPTKLYKGGMGLKKGKK